ncbi:hypothetical protein [Litorimonas sp. WD9-15]
MTRLAARHKIFMSLTANSNIFAQRETGRSAPNLTGRQVTAVLLFWINWF